MQTAAQPEPDVLVIGAGMAGLAAARTLCDAGLGVLLLESQDRIGGRIQTLRHAGEIVELGAEFIHGRPPELWSLIEEAELQTYERTGDFLRLEHGALRSEAEDQDAPEPDPLELLKNLSPPDCTFLQYIDRVPLSPEGRAQAIAFVEGFNAADAREASALALGRQQAAEDAIDGDRLWRLSNGYDQLPQYVAHRIEAAGGIIRLGTPVHAVDWTPGRVRVRTPSADFHAAQAVVALPLGVLQAGAVRFTPPPGEALDAAARLRMGQVCRFTLLFRRRLWPENMSFLMARDLLPSVWWTAHPASSLTLTGWIGGPRSAALGGQDQAKLAQHGCLALAAALNLPQQEVLAALAGVWTRDWQEDPNVRGAYSWIPVGSIDEPARMAQPVAGTLFFAGEHTDLTGQWGTVHAALRSGLRAAAQVLENRSAAV